MLVARGAGEPSIEDMLALWHGDLQLPEVRGIGYTDATDVPTRPDVARPGPFRHSTATAADLVLVVPGRCAAMAGPWESLGGFLEFC